MNIYTKKLFRLCDYLGANHTADSKYIAMAYSCISGKTMRHNDDKNGFFFHRNYLYQNFGSASYPKNWKTVNERFGFFEKQKLGGSRVYYLTELGMSEIEKHVEETLYEESDWIDLDTTKPVEKLPPSMLALDAGGKRAIRPANLLPNLVEINIEALRHGLSVLELIKAGLPLTRGAGAISDYVIDQRIEQSDEVEWAKRCIAAINCLIYEATNSQWGVGFLPQCYQQAVAGRWYSHGSGFTSVRRLVRNLAFWHLKHYDLDNAHLSLLIQMSGQNTWPALLNYLENKSAVRQQIAFDLGIAVEQVKETFLAITFGALRKGQSIQGILNGRHHDFMAHSIASAIVKEIQQISKLVVSKAKTQRGRYIANVMGRGISHSKKNDRQILAHLCQGAEALILKTVLDSPWGSSVVVPIHDGWFANEQMPVDELEKFVFEQTGFQVSISEDKN